MDQERRKRLHQVRSLERLVRIAVNTEDPLGLLGGGAPEDEYNQEIELVLGGLVRFGPDEPELTSLIEQVFDKKFWPGAVSKSKATRIALMICQGWDHATAEQSSP